MEEVESLVCAARAPDLAREQRHAAFGRLVDLFQRTIYIRAYRLLHDAQIAQDVTQETFLTAYQQLAQLREPRAFPVWLTQILRTHCNRLARKATLPTCPLDAHGELQTSEPDPAHALTTGDVRESVLAAIATLPDQERTVVQLFYFQGFSLNEIAERLKLPATTIKKRLQYARDRLRRRMVDVRHAGVTRWQLIGDKAAQSIWPLRAILLWPSLVPAPVFSVTPVLRWVERQMRHAYR
jgi:RNA polymerase sigma factor (sigma-70 family)